MNGSKIRSIVTAGLVLLGAFAAGFLAGSLRANGRDSLRYGVELESVRAEQRRTEEQYFELRVNYTRERELNSRIRNFIESSAELLQSNDSTISGLRKQTAQLREKIQELKDLFDSLDTRSDTGGIADHGAVDEVTGP
jgi:chromosome segregation ATPase